MDIIWHGHSCFTIKGKDATIVTDPYTGLGVNLPKLKANIVSLAGEGEIAEVEGDPMVLDWPGEYEVSNVSIESICPLGDETNIFVFTLDGLRIAHLGYLSHELSDEILEKLGEIDILLAPVGNTAVMDGKMAQKVAESIEPRIVIPMLYAATESKLGLKGPEEFLKAVGKIGLEAQAKLTAGARSTLPQGTTEFVLLEPQL